MCCYYFMRFYYKRSRNLGGGGEGGVHTPRLVLHLTKDKGQTPTGIGELRQPEAYPMNGHCLQNAYPLATKKPTGK